MPGNVLRKRLSQMALSDDHLILLDCPPSLSLLTVNALVASDCCLIPIESGSKYSLDGYEDLEELIRDVTVGEVSHAQAIQRKIRPSPGA
jgi:chromosome partitioning protein